MIQSLDEATPGEGPRLGDPTSMLMYVAVFAAHSTAEPYFLHTNELIVDEEFLQVSVERTPFVIGIAGSVAVGKSTTARLLRELLAVWPEHPRVSLVTTDGFLFPNIELESRGLLHRKGFPESYDRRALLRFVIDVKSGQEA